MRACFVLRLDPVALAAGTLRGEIEDVATALHAPVDGVGDVVSFCRRSAAAFGTGLDTDVEPGRAPAMERGVTGDH